MNYYQIRYFKEDDRGRDRPFNNEMLKMVVMSTSRELVKEWCRYNPILHEYCKPQKENYGVYSDMLRDVEKFKTCKFEGYDVYHSMSFDAYFFYVIEKIGYGHLNETNEWKNIKIINQQKVNQIREEQDQHVKKQKEKLAEIKNLEKQLVAVKRKREDDELQYSKKYREEIIV